MSDGITNFLKKLAKTELRIKYEEGPFAFYMGNECTPLDKGLQTWKINISPIFFKKILGDYYRIDDHDCMCCHIDEHACMGEISPVFTIRGILYDAKKDCYMLVTEIDNGIFSFDPVEQYVNTQFLYEVYWNNGPR